MDRTIKRHLFLLQLLVVLCAGTTARAEEPAWQVISAPELNDMIESHDTHSLMVIHVLSKWEYDMQHIPGSININLEKLKTSDRLPADKNLAIVLYCMGTRCPYTAEGADILVQKGYTQVYGFLGGIPEWRTFSYPLVTLDDAMFKAPVRKLSPLKLSKMLQEEPIYMIDVRPKKFTRDNHFIEGVHLFPMLTLADDYTHLPKDQPIVITDWAMKQAVPAAKFLQSKGYQIKGVLKGGMERWRAEEFPIVTIKLEDKCYELNRDREQVNP